MENLVLITNAEYLGGHTLTLTFSDGLRADVDFSPWIEKYPFFASLRDVSYFTNFSFDGWTVVWPNGADIAPETLHSVAVGAAEKHPVGHEAN